MKKIYNAPEASLLCFRPMEDLANDPKDFIDFDQLIHIEDLQSKQGLATETSANDITISF